MLLGANYQTRRSASINPCRVPAKGLSPYGAMSVSRAFIEACKFLSIKGAHFHDRRHDGVSRLFEAE
jgi:hypothetical protein